MVLADVSALAGLRSAPPPQFCCSDLFSFIFSVCFNIRCICGDARLVLVDGTHRINVYFVKRRIRASFQRGGDGGRRKDESRAINIHNHRSYPSAINK